VNRVAHLARRWWWSLSSAPPSPADEAWVDQWLSPGERALWAQLANADRRHAVLVARRFIARRPAATRVEMAAALLHDIGKVDSGLGVTGRVVATLVGPRGDRFRRYHDHEEIGAAMLEAAGAAAETVALVRGSGPAADDLRAADEV
jgi:hypothetical protein